MIFKPLTGLYITNGDFYENSKLLVSLLLELND